MRAALHLARPVLRLISCRVLAFLPLCLRGVCSYTGATLSRYANRERLANGIGCALMIVGDYYQGQQRKLILLVLLDIQVQVIAGRLPSQILLELRCGGGTWFAFFLLLFQAFISCGNIAPRPADQSLRHLRYEAWSATLVTSRTNHGLFASSALAWPLSGRRRICRARSIQQGQSPGVISFMSVANFFFNFSPASLRREGRGNTLDTRGMAVQRSEDFAHSRESFPRIRE